MGTAETAPSSVAELTFTQQYHWTEKQLKEENTVDFLAKLAELSKLQDRAQKVRERQQQVVASAKP